MMRKIRMMSVTSMVISMALFVGSSVASQDARAAEPGLEQRSSGGAMVADALVARPLLAVATVGGAAVFLVSLPFSALGGNVGETADTLIRAPAEAAFRRCLGCSVNRRGDGF